MKARGEGRSKLKKAMRDAQKALDLLREDWLEGHMGTLVDGGISYDHARIVTESAPELNRLAQALESEWGRVAVAIGIGVCALLLLASLVELIVGVLVFALPIAVVLAALVYLWGATRPS